MLDERLVQITPSERQIAIQETEYYTFLHFGMNSVTGREWGTGKEDVSLFNPTRLHTDEWCEIIRKSGSKGIILTVKHHDGFCLFPSQYTEHCIKNTPYREGKGDIVKELSDSCKKYGLKFGIYLSPWDRHEPTYGKNAYNDYYVRQLEELLGGAYGKIFCVWLDGARGKDAEVEEDFRYDFERIYKTVRTLQPEAVISVMGPDVRWIGNESAKPRNNEWSVVPASSKNAENIAKNSQTSEEDVKKLSSLDEMQEDLGSYEKVKDVRELVWYPAEADVSIRKGWFYHPEQKPKNVRQLLKIYYNTVGRNAMLLLNVPPDGDGKIDARDEQVLTAFGKRIADIYRNPVDRDFVQKNNEWELRWDTPKKIKHLVLQEDIRYSQRVESFSVYFLTKFGKIRWKQYGVIGYKRIVKIPSFLPLCGIGIHVTATRGEVFLKSMIAYQKIR